MEISELIKKHNASNIEIRPSCGSDLRDVCDDMYQTALHDKELCSTLYTVMFNGVKITMQKIRN